MATVVQCDDGCGLVQLNPNSNYDGGYLTAGDPGTVHACGMQTKTLELSPLHHFDMSAEIPSGDTVTAASLFLYLTTWGGESGVNIEDYTFTIYRVLRSAYNSDDWVTSEATWNIYKTGSNWGTAGCKNVTDRTATNMVQYSVPPAENWPTWTEIDVTELVKDAHAEDQILNILNCGLLVLSGESDVAYYAYSSYGAASNKPYLSITHEAGAPPTFVPQVMIF